MHEGDYRRKYKYKEESKNKHKICKNCAYCTEKSFLFLYRKFICKQKEIRGVYSRDCVPGVEEIPFDPKIHTYTVKSFYVNRRGHCRLYEKKYGYLSK